MTLYDINTAIERLIDTETGEIEDYEEFERLNMEKDEKIENIGLFIKNLTAEAKAIREEEKTLASRREAVENKVERLKDYLGRMLNGEKFSSSKVAISFRRNKSVKLDDNFVEWAKANNADFLRFAEPTADKAAIKQALNEGKTLPAEIIENINLIVK